MFFLDEQNILFINGQRVPFSPHQRNVFTALYRAKGRVLDRDYLLTVLDAYDVTDRTVDVAVKRLRARLEEVQPGAGAYIRTERGMGYFWDNDPPAVDDKRRNVARKRPPELRLVA